MIVVGGTNLGEADRLVRFLSAHGGRTAAVARAARKSRKRFGGMLGAGTRVLCDTRKGRGSLEAIQTLDLVRAPDRARRELDRIALLAYGCELCSALAPEDHGAPKLAGLLEVWLDLLEEEALPGVAACEALEAKALTFAGLAPTLDRCSRCGQKLEGELAFSNEAGGVVHAWCGAGRALTLRDAARFEALRRTPLAEVVNNPPAGNTGSGRWVLSDFARWHLGRALKSRTLLEEVLEPGNERR